MTLSALIDRLASAKEGSRELDARIYLALQSDDVQGCVAIAMSWPNYRGRTNAELMADWADDQNLKRYTTSLDAALSLVPEGFGWAIDASPFGSPIIAMVGEVANEILIEAKCATPSLALCLASLRARAMEGK